ncbi:MAG: hypothetical protein IJS60_08935 [Abditibacteriota bacterium]|nr:hypothetical protein [Abditibacteriota bacterium]
MDIKKYCKEIKREFDSGSAREHAYRTALKNLLEEDRLILAINEPGGISWGSPDFECKYKGLAFGYIECKDLNKDIEYSKLGSGDKEQRDRYLEHTKTLLCTNYNRFILYKNNKIVFDTTLFNNELKLVKGKDKDLEDLLNEFIYSAPIQIESADVLAERLAQKAKIITKSIEEDLNQNGENSDLYDLYKDFEEKLISKLEYKDFA